MKASEYKPRTSSPSFTNKYYIRKGKKYKDTIGVSNAIQISSKTHSTLPNCVGYVLGCTLEKTGVVIPSMNAQNFWSNGHKYGWKQSQVAKVGAIICYKKSSKLGHVGIVNSVAKDGTIVVSASDYGGKRFYTKKLKKPYKWSTCGTLQGFLLNPNIEDDTETPTETITRLTKENTELRNDITTLSKEIEKYNTIIEDYEKSLGELKTLKENIKKLID